MDIQTDIIPSMILAPSAHNTQPWSFSVGENNIDIFADWSRHLDVSDPSLRQLYVSIGCTIENGVIAAEHAGYSTSIIYFPEGEGNDKPVARLTFAPITNKATNIDTLFSAIKTRCNARAPYKGTPLSETERAALPTAKKEYVIFIEDESKKKEIAELSAKGTWKTLSDPMFKGELTKWVRSSITKQHDGMTGDAMGMPGPLALVAPFVIKKAPVHKRQTPVVKQQIATSAAVIVITTPEDSHEARMEAGRLLERLWVEAVAVGLNGSVIAAAIEAGQDLEQELKKALNTQNQPQAILRLGHAKTKNPKHTPRRTIEETVIT